MNKALNRSFTVRNEPRWTYIVLFFKFNILAHIIWLFSEVSAFD
jgi:hypothetical protein